MEDRINNWRRSLHRLRLEPGQVAELEAHLLDTVNELLIKGYDEERAFEEAVKRVGNPKNIARQEWNVSGKRQRRSRMPALVPVYFTQAWRHLRRAKAHTFITLTGLVAGLTACILLAIYVKFENSYDSFHEQPEQVYRMISFRNAESLPSVKASKNIAWAIRQHVPGVEAATALGLRPHPVVYADKKVANLDFLITDTSFNRVFRFRQVNGDTLRLDRPHTVYLTRAIAEQMFGGADPSGQLIRLQSTIVELEVIGVLADLPGNTHLDFDAVIPSLGTFEANTGEEVFWGFETASVYLRLNTGSTAEEVSPRIADLPGRSASYKDFRVELQPVTDIHLNPAFTNEFKPQGDQRTIRLFAYIALIILAIACVNTSMIAFAEYLKRVREIGVRKILGADAGSIATQFLAEHLIKLTLAVPAAISLAWGLLPQLSSLMDLNLGGSLLPHADIVALSSGVVALVVLLSGIVPALLVYRNQSRASLSGSYLSSHVTKYLRSGAIALQFGMGVFLIIYMLGIDGQLRYMQDVDLGYRAENLIRVDAMSVRTSAGAFRDLASALPEVESVSVTSWHPSNTGLQRFDSTQNRHVLVRIVNVDHATLETLGIPLSQGTQITAEMEAVAMVNIGANFRDDGTRDPSPANNPVLVSESYVRHYQLEEPVLGTHVKEPMGRIVGVFPDYNHGSLHQQREPVVFINHSHVSAFLIRYRPGTEQDLIPKLQAVHAELSDGLPMSYEFIDEFLAAYYEADRRQARLVGLAIAAALTLSLMGLFGMVAFSLERRTKEIGIRKILGANIPQLVWTLTKDVYALVLLGALIAAPFAYRLLGGWLEQYAYRFEPGWQLAALALLGAMVPVAALIVWQAGRAALENPVKALRSE